MAELAIDTVGYKNVPASAGSEPQQLYADKRTGPVEPAYFFPGTVPPGHKWHGEQKYKPEGDFDTVMRRSGSGPSGTVGATPEAHLVLPGSPFLAQRCITEIAQAPYIANGLSPHSRTVSSFPAKASGAIPEDVAICEDYYGLPRVVSAP